MRKDINLAILRMDASPSQKILARTILANYEAEAIASVTMWGERPQIVTSSTLRGKPLDVEFVEEASFFYGMEIKEIEQFTKNCYNMSYSNFDVMETNWSPVEVELEGEPYYYDMVLVNGRFWTFAPNLPEILEMAIF